MSASIIWVRGSSETARQAGVSRTDRAVDFRRVYVHRDADGRNLSVSAGGHGGGRSADQLGADAEHRLSSGPHGENVSDVHTACVAFGVWPALKRVRSDRDGGGR